MRLVPIRKAKMIGSVPFKSKDAISPIGNDNVGRFPFVVEIEAIAFAYVNEVV